MDINGISEGIGFIIFLVLFFGGITSVGAAYLATKKTKRNFYLLLGIILITILLLSIFK